MSVLLILTTLSACAAALLMLPFSVNRVHGGVTGASQSLLTQQLKEIDREEASGEMDKDIAAKDRIRIGKQMLTAASRPELPQGATPSRRIAIGISAVVVLGAIATFTETGGFNHSGRIQNAEMGGIGGTISSTGSISTPSQTGLPDVDTMIAKLADRLKSAPTDAEGWKMLGWSYFETKHYPKAVEAYRHAVQIKPKLAAYQSAYGEAQVFAADGTVTDSALQAFRAALDTAPDDEASHYYVGLAKSQKGDTEGAVREWKDALTKNAKDSKWSARLQEQISLHTGGQLPANGAPAPKPVAEPSNAPPPAQDTQGMSAGDRQAFIANMVDSLDKRLRASPDDPDGWIRLIRSRLVLGQSDRAKDALTRALAATSGNAAANQRIAATALALGVTIAR